MTGRPCSSSSKPTPLSRRTSVRHWREVRRGVGGAAVAGQESVGVAERRMAPHAEAVVAAVGIGRSKPWHEQVDGPGLSVVAGEDRGVAAFREGNPPPGSGHRLHEARAADGIALNRSRRHAARRKGATRPAAEAATSSERRLVRVAEGRVRPRDDQPAAARPPRGVGPRHAHVGSRHGLFHCDGHANAPGEQTGRTSALRPSYVA